MRWQSSVPSPQETLQFAILNLKRYVQRYLKRDVVLPTVTSLVADIEDLALIYNSAPEETSAEQRVSDTLPRTYIPDRSGQLPLPTHFQTLVDVNLPNKPLTSASRPTTSTAPRPPYRTSSTTASKRANSQSHPAYLALAYHTLLTEEPTRLLASTTPDAEIHDSINAWLRSFPRTIKSAHIVTHLSPEN